ncbi:MAG: hypothetical protein M3R71_03630 [Actinomycetota bacterium]|nr:hypothetical protein [Actinomycetota bacterium]
MSGSTQEGIGEPFRDFLAEMADGKRWELVRTEGWEEFARRLSELIGSLAPRRRQALVMLLFALSEQMLTPKDAEEWIGGHDMDSDEGIEAMIAWLRAFRPPPGRMS